MDIFEYAMKMEIDGKKYYEEHAARTKSPELKEILLTLAEEETRHFNFFKKMKEGEIEGAVDALKTKTSTIKTVKNIFIELSENNDKVTFDDDVVSVWTEALRIEEKSEKFYRDKAKEEKNTRKKELLNAIADEEQRHIYMIDGILTYLKHPDTFADSSQFKNFQSLEGH